MIINPLIPNVPLSFMYAIISINNQVIIIHLLIIIIYIICIPNTQIADFFMILSSNHQQNLLITFSFNG